MVLEPWTQSLILFISFIIKIAVHPLEALNTEHDCLSQMPGVYETQDFIVNVSVIILSSVVHFQKTMTVIETLK